MIATYSSFAALRTARRNERIRVAIASVSKVFEDMRDAIIAFGQSLASVARAVVEAFGQFRRMKMEHYAAKVARRPVRHLPRWINGRLRRRR